MKKLFNISFISLTSALMVVGGFANSRFVKTSAASSPSTDIPAYHYVAGWSIGDKTNYTNKGVEAIIPGASSVGTADAWSHRAEIGKDINSKVAPFLDLSIVDEIELTFSIVFYSDDGTTVLSQSQKGHDFEFKVYAGETQIEHLRPWTNSGSYTNGDHSYDLYGSAGNWDNKSVGYWMKGNATENSSFTLKFDKTKLLQSKVGGQTDFVPLTNDATLISTAQAAIESNSHISFEISGENGFSNDTRFILRAINGQSLAVNDNNFDDVTKPIFNKEVVSKESEFYVGETYEINPDLLAYDLLGNVSYSTSVDGVNFVDGRSFKFNEVGTKTITIKATDQAGNSEVKTLEVEVKPMTAERFATYMNQDHSETCATKYQNAKTIVLSMSEDEINIFKSSTDENIVSARERYEAWCRANFDDSPYSGAIVSMSNRSSILINNNASLFVLISLISLTSLFALSFALFKKKRHN